MTEDEQKTGFIQRVKDWPNWVLFGVGPMLPVLYVLSIGPVFLMFNKWGYGLIIFHG